VGLAVGCITETVSVGWFTGGIRLPTPSAVFFLFESVAFHGVILFFDPRIGIRVALFLL
jgi:hypothetical protein